MFIYNSYKLYDCEVYLFKKKKKKTIGIYRYQSLMIVIDIMNFITGHYYY